MSGRVFLEALTPALSRRERGKGEELSRRERGKKGEGDGLWPHPFPAMRKMRPEWFGPEVHPAEEIIVRAEIRNGLDGIVEADVIFSPRGGWRDAATGRPLYDAQQVVRWRFKNFKQDGVSRPGWLS